MRFKKLSKFQKFLLFVFAVFAIHRVFFRAPSEAEMIAKFREHKAEFEQIRLMLQQDKNVRAISFNSATAKYITRKLQNGDEIVTEQRLPLNVSPDRLEIYRSNLKKINLLEVVSRNDQIWFYQFGGGFTDTTWVIGYLWSEKTPKPLVKSAYYQMPGQNKSHFSKIEGDWYICHRR